MTDWPATVMPKWAITRNHAATVKEDAIREASVVPTGGQAGRWQVITDTTSIESSLLDLKEKGATPQDRRFLYVDCIKRTTAALGVGIEIIEPNHHLLNHLVTSFVAQVERHPFPRTYWRTKITDVGEIFSASREAHRISNVYVGVSY